ncbi:hypothetical protein HD806DRAFT_534739 [Xylariaceae sp. AK1471]|nr:hypothetical protein HD806DRAFT_534739 [Xylariaceae sp. AK1471]
MGKKRARKPVKANVDYRHRWPTTQTLVESQDSFQTIRSKRRWKSPAEWLQQLKRRESQEPGKSTHPYDTGVGEWENDSVSTSSITTVVLDDGQRWYKLFTRKAYTPSPLQPAPKLSHVRVELPRPETPKTPVQFLRLWTGPRLPISPFPRSRTVSPLDDSKKDSVESRSKSTTQLPATPRRVLCPLERARNRRCPHSDLS